MKHEEEIQETTTIVRYYCDVCGKEIMPRYCRFICTYCGKHVCNDHGVEHPEDYYSDYPDILCNQCYKVYKKYRPLIGGKETEIDKLEEKCKQEAVNNAEKWDNLAEGKKKNPPMC